MGQKEAIIERPAAVEGHPRLIPLEACRGIAACVVFSHHFLLGFSPHTHGGVAEGRFPQSIAGTLAYPFINGVGAVAFFFVLSGYVLPYRYFRTGRTATVMQGAAKRFFRLAGPAAVSTGLGALLLLAGLDFFGLASAISHSAWLLHMGGAGVDPGFRASFPQALWEGGVLTFFTGESIYNTNLWTMRFELVGSFLVYGLAVLFFHQSKRAPLFFFLAAALFLGHPFLLAFVLGTGLSWLHARRDPHLQAPGALCMLAVAFYLFGYAFPTGAFKPFSLLTGFLSPDPRGRFAQYLYVAAALCVVQSLMGWRPLFRALERPWAALLGKLSFPLYLIHPLLIFSWSSWLFVKLHGQVPGSAAFWMTLLATLPVLALGAILLGRFDDFWLKSINRLFKRKWL